MSTNQLLVVDIVSLSERHEQCMYHASMTRFGIRKKLKNLVHSALGGSSSPQESGVTEASLPPTPEPVEPAPPPVASPPKASPALASKESDKPASKPSSVAPPAAEQKQPESPGVGTTWVQLKRVAPDEIEDGTIRRIEVFGNRMALARVGEELFALQGKCPHGPGQLGDGTLDGHLVTCPVHGLEFDVRDGVCVSDSEMISTTVDVKTKGERVFVKVDT